MLDNIVNDYKNIFHTTVKVKSKNVTVATILTIILVITKGYQNLKLMMIYKFQNIKALLETLMIRMRKYL